jgi:D-serine deaminase-like pyridoxal phosphate-dependent protein
MNPTDIIGKGLDAIPTPALVVDREALDRNLRRMADRFATGACKLRPHFKSHKCVTLARRQLAVGSAVGITCAKLSEAEALVAGGVKDVLIANQVVGADKARRLAAANRLAMVRCAVDSGGNVAELGAAAREAGLTVGVLVEVDIGMGRCGVAPGEPTVALARAVAATPGLRLDGLQGYEGHLVMLPDAAERRAKALDAVGTLVRQRHELERLGLGCPIVSSGGTGTYDMTGGVEGVDEIQAGSYALMDCHYHRLRPEFENALSVLATVISAEGSKVVADVGLKGMGNDFGLPIVLGRDQAKVRYVAEEHAVIDNLSLPVGSRVRIIPSHGCTTANLHRRLWIVRGRTVEEVWPIEGSGCLE